MKHLTSIIIIFVLLFSCNGEQYFDYDNIDYYFIDFDKDKIIELYENKSKSVQDSIKLGVISGEIPNDLMDLTFIGNLEAIGYRKKLIEISKFKDINEIFVEKTAYESSAYACVPVYRDILVFKKNDKVVGVTKVCFDCRIHRIVGTESNTRDFGQSGDYERLLRVIKD